MISGNHETGFVDGSWCSVEFIGQGWRRMSQFFPVRLSHRDELPASKSPTVSPMAQYVPEPEALEAVVSCNASHPTWLRAPPAMRTKANHHTQPQRFATQNSADVTLSAPPPLLV
ncbi:hypothetical protein [Streptomyces sp. NPDC090994]|uniref:hypothetical protein n=1 Tax=Streptomyces sp. NPDC090994 TaxID=3365969 RepID=UPI0038223163